MAIIQSIRRINPLDLNKNVKIGVAFPLDEANMFSGTETEKEQIKANLINLLLTYPGERINLPNYGVGLKKLIFQQEQDINESSLLTIIERQTQIYIPRIQLQRVSTGSSEDKHTLFISLTYTYILDGSSDLIQLNFN
tara:strand:- start:19 stop:432 length:414 start_codon:yes stop_codon:yes gene_type:complete